MDAMLKSHTLHVFASMLTIAPLYLIQIYIKHQIQTYYVPLDNLQI